MAISLTVVDTVAELLASTTKPADGQEFQALGFYAANDGGGDIYRYDATSAATVDGMTMPGIGGTVSFDSAGAFTGTAGTGRFVRVDQTVANVLKLGAKGDNTQDDQPYFQAALLAKNEVHVPPAGTAYRITTALSLTSGKRIVLDSAVISAVGDIRPFSAIGTSGSRLSDISIRGKCTVNCSGGAGNNSGVAFHYVDRGFAEGVTVNDTALNGFEALDCTDIAFERCVTNNAQSFGIFYTECERCTDRFCEISNPQSFAHEIKSSLYCTSYELNIPSGSVNEHGLYIWTGFDTVGGTNPQRLCSYNKYINPVVNTTATGKNAIRVQGSPDNEIISPTIIHNTANTWAAVTISEEGQAPDGSTSYSDRCVITNPRITCGVDCPVGISMNGVTGRVLDGGLIENPQITGGIRGLNVQFCDNLIIRGGHVKDQTNTSGTNYTCLRVLDSTDCLVESTFFSNSFLNVAEVGNSSTVTFRGVSFSTGNNNGLTIDATSVAELHNCEIASTGGRAIFATGVCKIYGLTVDNCVTSAAGFPPVLDFDASGNIVEDVVFNNQSIALIGSYLDFAGSGDRIGRVDWTNAFTSNNEIIAASAEGIDTLAYAATTKVDFRDGNKPKSITLTGNVTLNLQAVNAGHYYVVVTQDGTGGRTVSYSQTIAGNATTVSTTASATTLLSLFYDGSSWYWASGTDVTFRKQLQDTVTFSATPTFDWDADTADNKEITLTANVTSSTFTATRPGKYHLIVKQDGTGSRTFAFPTSNINGNPPAPNTTASSTTVYEIYFDGTNYNF